MAASLLKDDPSNPQENLIDDVEDAFDVHVDKLADRLTTFFYHVNLKATYNEVKKLERSIKEKNYEYRVKGYSVFCPENKRKLDFGYFRKLINKRYNVTEEELCEVVFGDNV